LQKQWKAVGVDIDVKLRPEEEMQSDVLTRHDYDVLLYGISLGADPDVFAYWHSSQADVRSANRLNLSEYKSKTADKALEAGRTRIDPALRAVKYKPFLQAWKEDAPAIALYQPRFLYIARNELVGFKAKRLNSSVDRLNSIHTWTVLQDRVLK
jgi:peptide/nickel transport system substrate-binding protein